MRNILDIFDKSTGKTIAEIPLEDITPSRYQPRLHFDEEELKNLSASIKSNGLIQPITVRKIENGKYEIIAGERRFRACKMAGLSKVPCYILSPSEDEAVQMALVENIQRKDLTAIEEAKGYLQIMRQTQMSQSDLAGKIGKSQSTIANKIRLLNLPNEIQEAVLKEVITERHARALLTVEEHEIKDVFHHIVKDQLTVFQTEAYIQKLHTPQKKRKYQKTKGFSKSAILAINSVNKCGEMLRKTGIHASVNQEETDTEIVMTIRFPKG